MLITADALSADVLWALFEGEALAVRIPGYVEPDVCRDLARRLTAALDARTGYQRIYRSNVAAYTETADVAEARQRYLATSAAELRALRALCHPYPSPVDRLRCELDEYWPGGARLLRVDGRPLVFGMVRVWQHGAQALPHRDELRNAPAPPAEAVRFVDQLGANIFLRVADRPGTRGAGGADSGAVELWCADRRLAASAGQRSPDYGYPRESLPPPDLVVRPEAGDLLLIRTTRIHAVRPTDQGRRVTLSGFVGRTSEDGPLKLWS